MRAERIVYLIIIVGLGGAAAFGWQQAKRWKASRADLLAEMHRLQEEFAHMQGTASSKTADAEKLRTQTAELMRLRSEVTQLRSGAQTTQALQTENQRLRAENQQLRSGQAAATGQNVAQAAAAKGDHFPRESWNFAGYASPESALVSAIWAMKEGNPATYLDSLTPQEQQRMAQVWQNKSEQEIAAKHQQDVVGVTGMRVMDKRTVSPTEVELTVYLDGMTRVEKVRMSQVGQDWKFGGFIRASQQ